MKLNTLITLIAMATLGLADAGIVKAICWAVLFVNFFVFAFIFEKRYGDE